MKSYVWLIVALAAAAAGLLLWTRRRGATGVEYLPPGGPQVPPGTFADAAAYTGNQASSSKVGLIDRLSQVGNKGIGVYGDAGEQVFRGLCAAKTGGAGGLCNTLAPGANYLSQAAAAIPIKSTEYGIKAVKAVGSGAVSLVKKIF